MSICSFAQQNTTTFETVVAPFVAQNCAACHNDKLKTAGLALTSYHDTAAMLRDRDVWEKVVRRVRAGEMPPKGMPRPKPDAIESVTHWIEQQFDLADRTTPADPGHLTAHRLNRTEYNNTIRDLLAVNFKPAADFPADDSGYGFDNIGDVLSVSPVLMEKYLNAATKIAYRAIPSDTLPKPARELYSPEHDPTDDGASLEHSFDFPAPGEYVLRAAVSGKRDAFRLHLLLDGKEIQANDVLIEKDKPRGYEIRLPVAYGEHVLSARMEPRTPTAEEVATSQKMAVDREAAFQKAVAKHPEDRKELVRQRELENPPTFIDVLEIRGPYNPQPIPATDSYRRVFTCGHTPECIRPNLARLASLAYRRPVTDADIDPIVRLVNSTQADGMTIDQSMRVGLEAILVSPNFLYRIEHDPKPEDAAAIHAVNDYELASRLSYFLWSSMPDQQLLDLAGEKKLHEPSVLNAQVERMLADAKSNALIDNFFGQWMELRNLDSIRPDPEEFPAFNAQIRKAMYTESKLFVTAIVRENRSLIDFLNGNYTFLNERLAKYYGIPGVSGDEFRKVSLEGTERSGILTQGSVLTVTSYPTRTSPVLRGKWILENVLNAPPPPPPPGVGSIDAKGGPLAGTMRQQMEKHRANPMCASCHKRMDPLGFALENYNAVGQWRTHDAGQPVDASGEMPDGRKFNGSAELKVILASNKDTFAECLSEKMMTYALGRGLEPYDRRALKQIVFELGQNDYRFSTLITGIVNSVPFQMGRGDQAPVTAKLTKVEGK